MPYSSVDKGNNYFDTSLYTGTGSSLSVSNLNFQPDWVWLKGRSGATDHALYDAVRGVQKDLVSNATSAETTQTTGLTAFNSNGFTIGTLAKLNTSSATYTSWNWKANGAGSSNNSGTITSTVSANTTSGFSIVSYTGTGSTATVGHGLGVAPKMIIRKKRSGADAWNVYHSSIGNTGAVFLNLTNAVDTNSGYNNNTSPTSTVFSNGTDSMVNGNGSTYIAYCFAEVKGFSKAFSYTGNGSTDGTFVYCGFRPAWIIIKKSDGSVQNWVMHDSKRSTYNLSQNKLYANLSDAEGTDATNYNLDILSNGFKLRSSNSDVNSSGGAYIGFAIAENPFVTSKGLPVTAR